MSNDKSRKRFILKCILPSLILFTVFMILPTLNVFWMSLLKWGGLSKNKVFVGFNNFIILSQDMNFIRALQNTIFLIVIVTIITLSVAVIFASILVREKIVGQNFFRVVFYIPNILSVVVISAIFSAIYDPSNGLLNSIIGLFKPSTWETIKFLGSQKIVVYSIAGAMIWHRQSATTWSCTWPA